MKFYTKTKQRFQDVRAFRTALFSAVYWFLTIVYFELMLQFAAFGAPDIRAAYAVGFSLAFGCVIAVAMLCLPQKLRFGGTVAVAVLLILLYGSQMVYTFVFGTLYSVALAGQGGAAITSFWKETLLTMWEHLPWLLALLLPLVPVILCKRFGLQKRCTPNGFWNIALLVLALAVHMTTVQCLGIEGTGYFSAYYFYNSDTTTTEQAVSRFGLLTAFRLDLFDSGEAVSTGKDPYYVPQQTTPATEETHGVGSETQPEKEEIRYNTLEIDFDELSQLTEDKTLLALNEYCKSLTGTKQNEYTGMLSDYNLIVLCAESFSTGAIDPELTPTLYRMANEGIIFTNYYNSYPSNTTDGEYTMCMGLYPDFSRGKSQSSFYASRDSYVPYCLGNVFGQQKKIQSYGYHNYLGSYYGREESHTNMGYAMKFAHAGMYFTTSWPSSDLEMMEQSVDDYIRADSQFHAYYMTFSGHYKYDTTSNYIAARNWEQVADLDMSTEARCYLSCHIELEKALSYLMQRLEEEGNADKTAIVLAGDHFPYGLEDYQYSELVGYEIDEFSKYKSSLLFWVGGLEENIVVDKYCCNADILPTILNLWGFSYDSRMLAGTDVFSDGEHIAILNDMSFYTDKVWMNASTGEIRYLTDESQLPENYVENMIKLVQTKFAVSKDILNSAYYNFIFEQGGVTVDRNSWYTETESSQPAQTTAAEG